MDQPDPDRVAPPGDLAPYIVCLYRVRLDGSPRAGRADGAQLRFLLSPGPLFYRFAGGPEQRAPPVHLIGPTTHPFAVRPAGPLTLFGAGLTPAGWAAMLGLDASAALNRMFDAGPLLGADAGRAADALAGAGAGRLEALAAAALPPLRRLLARGDPDALRLMGAVDRWLAAGPVGVDGLAALAGLSRRQLERRCNAFYGVPPRLLARRHRALSAADALAGGDGAAWDRLADGFYDQSHLIREVKQFVGLTPGQIRADPAAFLRPA